MRGPEDGAAAAYWPPLDGALRSLGFHTSRPQPRMCRDDAPDVLTLYLPLAAVHFCASHRIQVSANHRLHHWLRFLLIRHANRMHSMTAGRAGVQHKTLEGLADLRLISVKSSGSGSSSGPGSRFAVGTSTSGAVQNDGEAGGQYLDVVVVAVDLIVPHGVGVRGARLDEDLLAGLLGGLRSRQLP